MADKIDQKLIVDFNTLISTNEKLRISYVNELKTKLEGMSEPDTAKVFQGLLYTYPRYLDRPSINAVLDFWTTAYKTNSVLMANYFKNVVAKEATKVLKISKDSDQCFTSPAFSRFGLLVWFIHYFKLLWKSSPSPTQESEELLKFISKLFDSLSNPLFVKQGLIQYTSKEIKGLVSLGNSFEYLLSVATKELKGYRDFTFLGYLLRGKADDITDAQKKQILEAYITNIVNSKTPIPIYVSDSLGDFLKGYVSEEILRSEIKPPMDKMVLRSPEIILQTMIPLFRNLSFDLSSILSNNLIDQILSLYQSSNPAIRQNSFKLLNLVCKKSKDEENLKTASDKLLKAASAKIASLEHRVVLYESCSALIISNSSLPITANLVKGMIPLIAKESNENGLQALIGSFTVIFIEYLNNKPSENDLLKSLITAFEKGIKSDKPGIRKGHFKSIGKIVLSCKENAYIMIDSLISPLLNVFTKIQTSPIASSTIPLEAYVIYIVLEYSKSTSKYSDILGNHNYVDLKITTPKTKNETCFLNNEKVLSKIVSNEDIEWFLRAFNVVCENYDTFSPETQEALSRSLISVAINVSSQNNINLLFSVVNEISKNHSPNFIHLILKEIESRLKNDSSLVKSQYLVIRKLMVNIFSSISMDEHKDLGIEVLILSNFDKLKSSDGSFLWITLISKANLNIESLVTEKSHKITQVILSNLIDDSSQGWRNAVFEAIRMVTFINPAVFGNVFMSEAIKVFGECDISTITIDDLNIWQTPEGTLYKDVLNKGGNNVSENRNRKNYEEDKWDREVRESLARKSGQNKPVKYTKEEQEAIKKQLLIESNIRSTVSSLVNKTRNAFSITRSLVEGLNISGFLYDVPQTSENLLSELIEKVFNVLKDQNSTFILKESGVNTWYSLRSVCSTEMNDIPELICYATLRSHDIKVPSEWESEPLTELISRLLFRLQMYSSRAKLSASALTYTLPLLTEILYSGGIGFGPKKLRNQAKDVGHDDDQPSSEMEQLLLALEIIGNHCSEGENDSFPRRLIFSCLIYTITSHPKLYNSALENLLTLGEALGQALNIDYKDIEPLVDGLLHESSNIRKACLQALEPIDLAPFNVWANIFIEQFDIEDKDVNINKRESEIASFLWKGNELTIPDNFESTMYSFLGHEVEHVRVTAAYSFGYLSQTYTDKVGSMLKNIYSMYIEFSKPLVPEYDKFGILIKSSLEKTDPYAKRTSLGIALGKIAMNLKQDLIESFLNFMIYQEALGDLNEEVRKIMLDACLILVNTHGVKQVKNIMPILQNYLDQPDSKSEKHDYIKEAVVILYGTLAKDLGDKKKEILVIMDRLVQTLDIPSESVQYAVANCIAPLVRFIPDRSSELIKELLDRCLNGEKYAIRRGAAYGLAGLVKGKGIKSIKEFSILATLSEAAQAKKLEHKQGAMFAFETMSEILNRLFEPYFKQILPLLLSCFSDGSDDVRRATLNTSRVIMSNLSEYGVKLMLPTLLSGLDDYQWRTKRGAVELLGSMAFCAPKQLAISLPTIVPHLILVLNDSHHQVKNSADSALNSFTNVINNPEIRSLMPKIMEALSDPDKNTQMVLKALLETPFVHYLDAPCLALIVPVLQRGLRERSTDVKCKASQIVGNMASLTDQNDLVPYLPELIPDLKKILADPVPEARGTSAKSIGAMVSKLGEINFPDIIGELLTVLKSESSSIDRSGAAQALSEILAGLDITRFEGLLPEIIANTKSSKYYIRESFVTLLIYIPATFGLAFKPYLHTALPPIINGLADESEYVRDASLRASQIIITSYSDKAVDLLLPELQRGIFEPKWRIRQASAQLMGDLLFKLMGIAGKVEIDDEDEEDQEENDMALASSEGNRKALLEALGKERRDLILSGLFIIRFDVSPKVRQVASAIWHMIVVNTPRTLKEILPIFLEQVLTYIISPHFDLEHMSKASLSDLVRKLGDNGLKEIMPIINQRFESTEFEVRQSACLALSEIINVLGKSGAEDFLDITTNAVLKALCDESSEVRETATKTFISLSNSIGPVAVDFILESLLKGLSSKGNPNSLEALRCLVSVRPGLVLPSAIAHLCVAPITLFNAKALSCLIEEGGSSLNNRLKSILIPLLESTNQNDTDSIEAISETIGSLLAKVNQNGVDVLMETLFEWVSSEEEWKKIQALSALSTFFMTNEEDINVQPFVVEWMRVLVPLYSIKEGPILNYGSQAFSNLVKSLDKSELDQLVIPLRQIVSKACKQLPANTSLPGFCLPKGVSPFLSIYLQGLMYSTSDIRERAAAAIGELVDYTSSSALRPSITQITGPLIRVIGERYSSGVRASILDTLLKMLDKAGPMLKPFLPQLQRTFIKSLGDTYSEAVRSKASKALDVLIGMLLRVDPLVTELISGFKSAEEDTIRMNYLASLATVVDKVLDKVSQSSKDLIDGYLNEILTELKGNLRTTAKSILDSL
ncbi:ARM repeat-containing protein [Neoconidiobolus thromboides FSU 785]|nr:ARM repeat-containing protein [Neoconidiobolus thromboides FSU 785]